MVTAQAVGGLCGLVAGVLLGLARGGARFDVAYGLLAAGVVWSAAAIIAGNRAGELAGLGELVLGGLLFWLLVVPAGIARLLMEARQRRGRP